MKINKPKSEEPKHSLVNGIPGRRKIPLSSIEMFTLVRWLEAQGRGPEYNRGTRFIKRYSDRYKEGLSQAATRKLINRLINSHNRLSGRQD